MLMTSFLKKAALALIGAALVLPGTVLAQAPADPAALGPYPARVLAWSDADKETQRQAGAKLIADLQAAVAAGNKTFVIPQGDYRFAKPQEPTTLPMEETPAAMWEREQALLYGSPKLTAFIKIDGARDLVIDGSGSTFWFEDIQPGLLFHQCRSVTLKNLAIDFDPLPFIQGQVVALHPDTNEFDVELDPAYLDPRSFALVHNPRPMLRGILFDPRTRTLKPDQRNCFIEDFWSHEVGPHTYRMHAARARGVTLPLAATNPAVGDLIALWRRDLINGRDVRLENCADMVLENISIYASPMTAVLDRGSLGQNIFRQVNIIRRPGTDRLMACNGDALSVLSCMTGPLVEQCRMEYAGDDFINPHAWYIRPLVQESPTVVVADRMPHPRFGVGAQVLIYEPHGVHLLGKRRIVACQETTWTATPGAPTLLKVDDKLPWTSRPVFLVQGHAIEAQRLTLDEPIDLPENALFTYPDFNNAGMVVRDNDFTASVVRAILARSAHVQYVNNRFTDIGGAAIAVDGELGSNIFGESDYPTDVLIQGNHFTRCAMFNLLSSIMMPQAAVLIYTPAQEHNPARPDTTEGWLSNIRVLDNVFTDCPREALRVFNVRDVTITGNTIAGYNQVPAYPAADLSPTSDPLVFFGMDHGIVLDHVLGLTLENNTLSQPGPATKGEYFRNQVTPAP